MPVQKRQRKRRRYRVTAQVVVPVVTVVSAGSRREALELARERPVDLRNIIYDAYDGWFAEVVETDVGPALRKVRAEPVGRKGSATRESDS